VAVDVSTDGGALRIAVRDDGRGFPFQGRYDHAALQEANLGPISLRERVASLGGTLTVESTPAGSCVEVVLPLCAAGRA
jgi:signal transduction histidine kinase